MLTCQYPWIQGVTGDIIFKMVEIQSLKVYPTDSFDITLPLSVRRSVSKRQYEYIGGRLAAKAACREWIGWEPQIYSDAFGRPVWPANVIGSITHTETLAVSAVAKRDRIKAIGIDSEVLSSNPMSIAAISDLALDNKDKELVEDNQDYFLIFSAKEALYKCLHPLTQWVIEFQDVRVVRHDRSNHIVFLRFVESSRYCKKVFAVHYSYDSFWQHVHTCVWL